MVNDLPPPLSFSLHCFPPPLVSVCTVDSACRAILGTCCLTVRPEGRVNAAWRLLVIVGVECGVLVLSVCVCVCVCVASKDAFDVKSV